MKRLFARAIGALGIVVVAACHGTVDSRTPDSACDDYFAAIGTLSSCGSGANPLGGDKERFHQVCVSTVASPGTGLTPQWLDACAATVKSTGCDVAPFRAPACVAPAGSLADGAGCGGDDQCLATSFCKLTQTTKTTPSGTTTELGQCGTCAPRVADGAACTDGFVAACMTDSACSAGVCKKIVYADAGAACGISFDAQCKPGLSCDFQSKTCLVPGGAGAACTSSFGCKHDFACVNKACVARLSEGAACDPSQRACASDLQCAKATSKCTRRVFAKSGEACDGDVVVCQLGSCSAVLGPAGTTPGTCPTVLADGAACDSTKTDTTCNSFARCIGGTCQVPNRSACK